MMSIKEQVITIIIENTGVDPAKVHPEALFEEDLGLDSLYVLDLVVAFEYEFGVVINDEDIKGLKRVSDAIAFVENRTIE